MISLPSKSVYTLYRPVESSVKRDVEVMSNEDGNEDDNWNEVKHEQEN